MNRWTITGSAALLACVAQPVLAESTIVQAVPVGRESVRYDQGVPTLDLRQRAGAVQVTPLGIEHGNLVFGVVVFNDGPLPAAFDSRNITVTSGGMPVPVLSPETLASKAKSRSIWRMVALAAVGGVAAVASANQQDTYRTKVRTPRGGTYRITRTGPSAAGQFNAALITAGTSAGIVAMQARLDEARMRIGTETLQLTTVDPGTSYGGRVTLARIKAATASQAIAIHVDWNGEPYDFAFRMARKGTPAPVFVAAPAPGPGLVPAVVTPLAPVRPTLVEAVAAPNPPGLPKLAPVTTGPAATPVDSTPFIMPPTRAYTTIAVVRPVAPAPERSFVAYAPPAEASTDYQRRLAAQRGTHGRDAQQGWSISD